MPAPLDQSRRERRFAVIRTCYTLAEAAGILKISELGLAKWLRGEGIEARELLLTAPPRPPVPNPPDTFTQRGAQALADRIEAYWQKRGYFVRCQVVRSGDLKGTGWHYDVRSDLVNGLPSIRRAARVR